MRLSNKDKEFLVEDGFNTQDFYEIQQAANSVIFLLNGKRISRELALKKLGRQRYFHAVAKNYISKRDFAKQMAAEEISELNSLYECDESTVQYADQTLQEIHKLL